MTHAQLFTTHLLPGGVEPVACPGELTEVGHFDDAKLDKDADGRPQIRPAYVVVYDCPECGHRLSVSEGVVRNAYRPTAPAPRIDA